MGTKYSFLAGRKKTPFTFESSRFPRETAQAAAQQGNAEVPLQLVAHRALFLLLTQVAVWKGVVVNQQLAVQLASESREKKT